MIPTNSPKRTETPRKSPVVEKKEDDLEVYELK